jgi:HD superfamily phosphohydrolase
MAAFSRGDIEGIVNTPRVIVDDSPLVSDLCRQFEFYKLRGIRQLSFVDLNNTNSTQSRLSHSIDTYYNCLVICEALGLSDEDKKLVSAASLLHDVGYMAYGHITDRVRVLKGLPSHDRIGAEIVRGNFKINKKGKPKIDNADKIPSILDSYEIDKDVVAQLIEGSHNARPYLQQIISGPHDGDRISYVRRDSRQANLKFHRFDVSGLIASMFLKDNHICLSEEGVALALELNAARNIMHEELYNNPNNVCANEMLEIALLRGNIDLDDYFELNDDEFCYKIKLELSEKAEAEKTILFQDWATPALKLISRIHDGNLYVPAFSVYRKDSPGIEEVVDAKKKCNIEAEIARAAGLGIGDVIIKLPVKGKNSQRVDSLISYVVDNGEVMRQRDSITHEFENGVKEKYGIRVVDDSSYPVVRVFCDRQHKKRVEDAARDYFKLKCL